ncbi:hypothetical protein PTTG_27317 [Puccinia triticina 1-1 BBBD Race 1]|uniref:Uncharacterized protein n=1 Tax=Puccinia triticina (isolate 1-1 / race 1 (BBBD)) TaxID=630390 RepID=A0A180GKQ7_PUCT1|nr:hypothetical protein PTTG_27317 [Puccinia triticina 1-1 BBBD Race 1]
MSAAGEVESNQQTSLRSGCVAFPTTSNQNPGDFRRFSVHPTRQSLSLTFGALQTPPMSNLQVQAKRLADYYRPRYTANTNQQQASMTSTSNATTSAGGGGVCATHGNW